MSGTARRAGALWRRVRRAFGMHPPVHLLASEDAYRLWSQTYDAEPDNVLLTLEEDVFGALLSDLPLADKVIVDVGCGTGRHWKRLLAHRPAELHGVDSSAEMLARLRIRYPDARVHLRSGRRISEFGDGSIDVIVSTLMLGYARGLHDELTEWTRLVRIGGEIILTEFHPDAIRSGMKRTFTHQGKTFEIEHERFTVEQLRSLLKSLNLEIVRFQERKLDHTVRASFERQNYADGYRKGLGNPLVVGFRLRRAA